MRFIFFIIVMFFTGSNFCAGPSALPKTSITLNNKKGCAVHIAAWLSPSCTHCAEYFTTDIPEIVKMPGFCLDLHFLPHLYVLDMPVAVLIWSQGPDKAYKIAEFFYKGQNEWLGISAAREKFDDPRRVEDLNSYFASIQSDKSKNLAKIKAYLEPSDPYLYVKIFALRYFSVEHLEKYLPKGRVDTNISMSLLSNLPSKDGKAIIFSPAFTSTTGQLMPDSQLHRGILTSDAAKELLKKTAPFVPQSTVPQTTKPTPKKAIAKKAAPIVDEVDDEVEDSDIQDADDPIDVDTDDEEAVEDSLPDETDVNIDEDPEMPNDIGDDDETTQESEKLSKIIDDQIDAP